MNFIFSCSTRYLTRSLRSLVRYRVDHSNIKFISTRGHVISSMYYTFCTGVTLFCTRVTHFALLSQPIITSNFVMYTIRGEYLTLGRVNEWHLSMSVREPDIVGYLLNNSHCCNLSSSVLMTKTTFIFDTLCNWDLGSISIYLFTFVSVSMQLAFTSNYRNFHLCVKEFLLLDLKAQCCLSSAFNFVRKLGTSNELIRVENRIGRRLWRFERLPIDRTLHQLSIRNS